MYKIELKLCPFCGSSAVLHVDDCVRVVCIGCGTTSKLCRDIHTAEGYSGDAVQRVVEAWNRRVSKNDIGYA